MQLPDRRGISRGAFLLVIVAGLMFQGAFLLAWLIP